MPGEPGQVPPTGNAMSTERKMIMGWVRVAVAPEIFASRADEYLMQKEKLYLGHLQRSGEIYLSGPLADGSAGLVVYDVQSLREAERLVEDQPMVRAGLLSVELHEMFAVNYASDVEAR
jgi:uncharacterized protein YciI